MRHLLLIALISFALISCKNSPNRFDLLILNGKIYDSQRQSFYESNIGVIGDKIAAIGDLSHAEALRTIDASGHIVSPGFIDVHAHIESIMRLPQAESFVKQGVTTVLAGPDGRGPSNMAEFLNRLDGFDLGINTAWLIGHNSLRRAVMGSVNREPSSEELQKMISLIDHAMDHGEHFISL